MLLRRFVLCYGAQIQSTDFWFVESTPKKAFLSLLPSLDSWEAVVVYVNVNWGLSWAGVWIYLCIPLGITAACPDRKSVV